MKVGQESLIKTLLPQNQLIIIYLRSGRMRKAFFSIAFILILLFSAVAGEYLVNSRIANFYREERWTNCRVISSLSEEAVESEMLYFLNNVANVNVSKHAPKLVVQTSGNLPELG
jgi:hypothetical protein